MSKDFLESFFVKKSNIDIDFLDDSSNWYKTKNGIFCQLNKVIYEPNILQEILHHLQNKTRNKISFNHSCNNTLIYIESNRKELGGIKEFSTETKEFVAKNNQLIFTDIDDVFFGENVNCVNIDVSVQIVSKEPILCRNMYYNIKGNKKFDGTWSCSSTSYMDMVFGLYFHITNLGQLQYSIKYKDLDFFSLKFKMKISTI